MTSTVSVITSRLTVSGVLPSARRRPNSRVRSRTDIRPTLVTPMMPTNRAMTPIAASSSANARLAAAKSSAVSIRATSTAASGCPEAASRSRPARARNEILASARGSTNAKRSTVSASPWYAARMSGIPFARRAVFAYLSYHNHNRLHSTLPRQTPYEARVCYRQPNALAS